MTNFSTWLDTFVSEKQLDLGKVFLVEGESGTNFIPCEVVINEIKTAPTHEQAAIKTMIVKIDFRNGNVMHYFGHLAQALAI